MNSGFTKYYRSALDTIGPQYYPSYFQPKLEPQTDEVASLGKVVDSKTAIHRINLAMRLKRIFDIVFAVCALIALTPVFLIAAVAIKLESRGPIFYKQERVGVNRRFGDRRHTSRWTVDEKRGGRDRRKNIQAGRPFDIYKLRTMREDAEKSGPSLACENDPRITKFGRIMRKTRIDEIPQFINVLKGDMSIIGPRPERSFYINQIKQDVPEFPLRLRVKPGITGLAQVEAGYIQTLDMMKKKLLYDLKYISDLSLFQELSILLKTVYVVLSGKGAC